MITQLKIKALKGVNRTVELGPINIVTGRNWRGKSAILDAVCLSLCGYVPSVGRTNAKTMKLASDRKMSVSALHTDRTLTHMEWSRDGSSVRGPATEGITLAPPVMLDIREFTRLSAADQAAYVFAQSDFDPSVFNFDAVSKVIREADLTTEVVRFRMDEGSSKFVRQADPKREDTDGVQYARRRALDIVQESVAASRKAKTTLPEWLASLVDDLKGEVKLMKAVVKDLAGTVRTQVEQATNEPEPAFVGMSDVEKATAAVANYQAMLKAAMESTVAYAKAVALRSEEPSLLASIQTMTSNLRESEAVVADLEAKTANAPDARSADREWQVALRLLNSDKEKSEHLKKQIADFTSETEATLALNECPTCRCVGDTWKVPFRAARNAQANTLNAEWKAVLDAIDSGRVMLGSLRQVREDAIAAESAFNQLREQLQNARQDCVVLRINIQSAQARLNSMPPLPPEPSMTEQQQKDGVIELDKLKRDAENVSFLFRKRQQWDAKRESAKQAERELIMKENALRAMQMVTDLVVELQGTLADRTVGALIADARRLTDGILTFELAYKDGEFGYVDRRGAWVSSDTFSTGEQRIAFAGIQMALARKHPEKVMLLDEMGVLGPEVKSALMDRIEALVSNGFITQFIGVDIFKADHEQRVSAGVVKLIEC